MNCAGCPRICDLLCLGGWVFQSPPQLQVFCPVFAGLNCGIREYLASLTSLLVHYLTP